MKRATKILLATVLAILLVYLPIYATPLPSRPIDTGLAKPFTPPVILKPLSGEWPSYDERQTVYVPPPITPGSHTDWMAQAGIAPSEFPAVEYIYTRESGWNVYAVNPTSGACGLNQEWPCGKSGCATADAICQLRWGDNYAKVRYGGWWAAQAYWQNNHFW